MRGARLTLALLALPLALGCAQVAGLDEYCPLERNAPFDARCRLVAPSCGCSEGFTCRLDVSTLERSCESTRFSDQLPAGESCDRTDDCAGGSLCAFGVCTAYCEVQEDCAAMGPTSVCLTEGILGLCTQSCRPFGPECGSGFKCSTIEGGTTCSALGTAELYQPCSEDNLCRIGLQCAQPRGSGFLCLPICGPGAELQCANGAVCERTGEGTEPLGPDEYGVCPP